ncbi:MAG: glycosyltransferase family 39 protein [Thermoplasmata archaeon]|nr:glycosyltransferase family 39 protein [Thermoplasmata archaeon]
MDDASNELDEIHAARQAAGRVQALRARGIPFDPVTQIVALRKSLSGAGPESTARLAAALETTCDRVEVTWNELETLRPSISRLSIAVRRRWGRSAPSLLVAAEFLRTWSDPFVDSAGIETRLELARQALTELQHQLGVEAGSSAVTPSAAPTRPSAPVAPKPPAAPPAWSERPPSAAPTRPRVSAPAIPARRPVQSSPSRLSDSPVASPGAPPGPIPQPLIAWLQTAGGATFLVVGVLVLIGAYDRLHALGALSLWNDEAQSTLLAFSVLRTGYPVISSQHLINNYEPLYPYFEAASIRLFGQTNFAYRLPSAFFGIVLIPVAYYVGSRLRDRYVGISLAAMTAFSSEFIAWSRQARWYILLVLIMAIAFLFATAWARTAVRRERWLLFLGLVALAALGCLASFGLFLVYVPAIFAGGFTYYVARHWEGIRRQFGLPSISDAPLPRARFLSYPQRRWLAVLLPLGVLGFVAIAYASLSQLTTRLISRVVGFTPYPIVWSSNFGTYLAQYYLGVLVLVAIGAIVIVIRRNPVELALLAFCVTGFVGVSTLASLTNDIATIDSSFERHLVPLLFFLFLVAAIGIVEILRYARQLLTHVPTFGRPRRRAWRPLAFGVIVVVLLVLPGVVVPSGQTVNQRPAAFPTGTLIAWNPFSIDPKQPSIIYQAEQADYQGAAEYVLAHRTANQVLAATNPGPPQIYLGQVQYWVRGNPDNNTIVYVGGQATFFQTDSDLIDNTSLMEGMLFNSSGWFISDVPAVPSPKGIVFPGAMWDLLILFFSNVTAADGPSIVLYEWNQTSVPGMLLTLGQKLAPLHRFGTNLSAITDWAATSGVTWSQWRDFFVSIEPYLVRHASSSALPLAVLFQLYNDNPSLQSAFPQVLTGIQHNPTEINQGALVQWAIGTAEGKNPTPVVPGARAMLAPYLSEYESDE